MENHSKINYFLFWQKWLFFSSLLFALFGLVFAFYGSNPLFIPYEQMLAQVFWNSAKFPVEAEPFRAFIYGPLGGTVASSYILLAFISWYPFKEKKRWARNAIMLAFGTWVLTDSVLCFRYGVYPQIYFVNAFSVVVKALPIIFTWKEFRSVR